MRTAVAILADFDAPLSSSQPANGVASTTRSIWARATLEVLLDIREELVETNTLLDECKTELVEIKANTAS